MCQEVDGIEQLNLHLFLILFVRETGFCSNSQQAYQRMKTNVKNSTINLRHTVCVCKFSDALPLPLCVEWLRNCLIQKKIKTFRGRDRASKIIYVLNTHFFAECNWIESNTYTEPHEKNSKTDEFIERGAGRGRDSETAYQNGIYSQHCH